MTDTDAKRLADIRMQVMKWYAIQPDSCQWDNSFLLQIIDMLLSRKT